MTITNITLHDYCRNPDGVTYNGVKMVQWLYEAGTGKPLSIEEAQIIVAEAQAKAAAKKAAKT